MGLFSFSESSSMDAINCLIFERGVKSIVVGPLPGELSDVTDMLEKLLDTRRLRTVDEVGGKMWCWWCGMTFVLVVLSPRTRRVRLDAFVTRKA
jgi:hypothetical protein